MRVLHTIRSVDTRGGGPISGIISLAEAYRSKNHSLEIVSLDFPDDDWVRACPVKVHALGLLPFKYGYSPQFVQWLRRESLRFDAVVVNGLWLFNSFGAWMALNGGLVPYYVFPHGMLDPWFKRYYPLKHLKKWLYWPWAEYRVLRDATAVLFTTEEERRQARESFWLYGCHEEVVPYGLGSPPEPAGEQIDLFLRRFPFLREKRRWLFLGRLHEKKGCDLLLRAFAKVASNQPDLHLVMVGPDQQGLLASYQKMAQELGLQERVTWAGMLVDGQKWGAYRSAEVFILPSHQENFGIAVAESLACGTPVLISNKVNIWREVISGGAGLVGEDTESGTEGVLREWLSLTESERAGMRQRALACFHKNFHVESFVRRLEEIFSRSPRPTR